MQNYNLVHTVKDITASSGDPTEPVSVDEVKSYMRLEGFQDVDDSDSTVFDDDDTLISDLIVSARKRIEKYYGISLVPKTLRAVITNLAGDIEIPNGPVQTITSIRDRFGNLITTYTITGYTDDETSYDDFIQLECPNYEKMVIEYEAGYTDVPEPMKIEIMRYVTWLFTYRGDQEKISQYQFGAGEYNRNSWLA
jgi:uncharacterized phiE125 gp8 family phage protein